MKIPRHFWRYAAIGLLINSLLLFLLQMCSTDPEPSAYVPNRRAPDTTKVARKAEPVKITTPEMPAHVTQYAPDTARRERIEKKQPIITQVRKETKRGGLFKKPKYHVHIERIDTAGLVQLNTYQMVSPNVDFAVDEQGNLQVDQDSEKRELGKQNKTGKFIVGGIIGGIIVFLLAR